MDCSRGVLVAKNGRGPPSPAQVLKKYLAIGYDRILQQQGKQAKKALVVLGLAPGISPYARCPYARCQPATFHYRDLLSVTFKSISRKGLLHANDDVAPST